MIRTGISLYFPSLLLFFDQLAEMDWVFEISFIVNKTIHWKGFDSATFKSVLFHYESVSSEKKNDNQPKVSKIWIFLCALLLQLIANMLK